MKPRRAAFSVLYLNALLAGPSTNPSTRRRRGLLRKRLPGARERPHRRWSSPMPDRGRTSRFVAMPALLPSTSPVRRFLYLVSLIISHRELRRIHLPRTPLNKAAASQPSRPWRTSRDAATKTRARVASSPSPRPPVRCSAPPGRSHRAASRRRLRGSSWHRTSCGRSGGL